MSEPLHTLRRRLERRRAARSSRRRPAFVEGRPLYQQRLPGSARPRQPRLRAGRGSDIYVPASGCGTPALGPATTTATAAATCCRRRGQRQVVLFANTNTDEQPVLAAGVTLQLGTNDLSVGWRARPMCTTGRRRLDDLLCGDGTATSTFPECRHGLRPAYNADVLLQAGGPSGLGFARSSACATGMATPEGPPRRRGHVRGWCRNTAADPNPCWPRRFPAGAGGCRESGQSQHGLADAARVTTGITTGRRTCSSATPAARLFFFEGTRSASGRWASRRMARWSCSGTAPSSSATRSGAGVRRRPHQHMVRERDLGRPDVRLDQRLARRHARLPPCHPALMAPFSSSC